MRSVSTKSFKSSQYGSIALLLCFIGPACGGDALSPFGAGGENGIAGEPSNRVRFAYDCNFGGTVVPLVMDIEAIGDSGIAYGPGVNPDIIGVVSTGDFIYYTSGSFEFPDRTYWFEGESIFAELWSNIPGDRLTVEWRQWEGGLIVVWDWFERFGPATQYPCQVVAARYL
ncbi:MAG: hypothetical protein ACFB9M_09860 [Myxococcota bacterium]